MVQLRDIATEAEVSIQTVSRALTGKGYVSEPVRERVQRIADRLGYRPNRAAQRLRGGLSDEIVAICVSTDESSVTRLSAFERVMRDAGFRCTMMLDHPGEADMEAITRDLLRSMPAAVITGRVMQPGHLDCIRRLEAAGVPALVMDSRDDAEFGVAIDRVRGVNESMTYLISRGHERIAYVGLPADPSRRDGYDRVIAENCLESLIIPIDRKADRFEQGKSAIEAVLDVRPTAVQAFNDEVAFGLIAAASERGLRIPDDLAVVGFDNLKASAWCTPALTTVALPNAELGETAARMLLQQLNPKSTEAPLPRRHIAPARLIVRQTA